MLALWLVSPLAMTFLNPTDYAKLRSINICAGNVRVQQDPRFSTLLPAQEQTLPLDYCSSWPIWVTKKDSKNVPVTRVSMPEENVDFMQTWVPPAAFEQMWLPEDLPTPKARAAIGLVLRNGDPRYVFPTVDTYLEADGQIWRNRGLNSVPIAKTWLHFGELPPEALRFSAYHAAAEQEQQPAAASTPESADDDDEAASGSSDGVKVGAYTRVVANCQVHTAVDAAFDALADLPPLLQKRSLGDGFCYLIVPLEAEGEGGEGGGGDILLPPSALKPGGRLRAFLSEDGADEDGEAWQRGELDLSMWRLPPGKDSPWMQKQYSPLYERDWSKQ